MLPDKNGFNELYIHLIHFDTTADFTTLANVPTDAKVFPISQIDLAIKTFTV